MFSNRKSQTPGAVGDPSHILRADIHQLLMYSSSNSSVTWAQSMIPHSLKHKYKPFFPSPQNIYSWDIKNIKFVHAVYKTGSYVKCMQLYLWLKMNICFSHQQFYSVTDFLHVLHSSSSGFTDLLYVWFVTLNNLTLILLLNLPNYF